MARPCVTYTEIANAIARLQAENKATTADNVRNVIGSGSKTTIVKHLRTWKEANTLEAQGDGLPLPLLEALKGLWTCVRNEANEEIAIHEAQADERIEAMEMIIDRLQELEATQKRENASLEVSLSETQARTNELKALLQEKNTENVRLKEQNDGLARQCTQHTDEIARLHQIVKQVQGNLEHYQAENLKLKETHSLERENERHVYMQEVRLLESKVGTLSEHKAVLENTLEHVNKNLSKADLSICELETAQKTLIDQVAENKAMIALLENKNQALFHQSTKQEQQLKESTEQLCSALNQISSLANKHESAQSNLRKAEDKVQALMDQKLFLIQENAELLGQMKVYQRAPNA